MADEEIVAEFYLEQGRAVSSLEPINQSVRWDAEIDPYMLAVVEALQNLMNHMGGSEKVRFRVIRREVPNSPPPSAPVH